MASKNGNGKRFKMVRQVAVKGNGNGFANGHIDHASRVQAATTRRDDVARDLFACLGEHHAATVDALTAAMTAAGIARSQ
jgi:hypothetical protein